MHPLYCFVNIMQQQGPPPPEGEISLMSFTGIKFLWSHPEFRSMVYGHARNVGFFAVSCALIAKYGALFDIYA